MPSASESAIVPAQVMPPISFSPSSSCALADTPSARKPIWSDCTSATTPRITGSR